MAAFGIEISDVGILAAGGDPVHALEVDRRSIESPGHALQVKKHLVYGMDALEQARLHPRQVNNRYWAQLSAHRLGGKAAPADNYAEMAFAHLKQIRDRLDTGDQEWVVAAPDFLDEGKLGLLLGIARELDVPIRGLVSLPVAAVQATATPCPILHVDVHLHRVEIAHVVQSDRIALERTNVIAEDGWDNLLAQIVKVVADHFVKATRFDPLHDATSEQQLFNQLSQIVRRGLPGNGVTIELSTDHNAYSLSVLPAMLLDASSVLRGKVLDAVKASAPAGPVSVQLSHRARLIPGLRETLASMPGVNVEDLAPGAGAIGVLRMRDELTRDPAPKGLAFMTSRNRRPDESAPPPEVKPDTRGTQATHVLVGDEAFPVGVDPLVIGTGEDGAGIRIGAGATNVGPHLCSLQQEDGSLLLKPVRGCDVRVDGIDATQVTPVTAGQRIELGDPPRVLHLIVVHPSHGP